MRAEIAADRVALGEQESVVDDRNLPHLVYGELARLEMFAVR